MDLSFQEKSAWGLLIGIVLVSLFYFPAAFEVASRVPHGVPLIALSTVGVVALIVIEAVYHGFIALSSGGDQADERDVLIDLKAERNAGFVLGLALFLLVGYITAQSTMAAYPVPPPLEIAVWVLLTLAVSEVAKLASQIWYYRTGV